jgi:hypothetical protein
MFRNKQFTYTTITTKNKIMTTRGFTRAIGIVGLLLLVGTAVAQQAGRTHADKPAHAHQAPHGGIVKSAGDYHIELVDTGPKIRVYLLDIRERSLNLKGVTGIAIFRNGDVTTGTQRLSATGDPFFEIPLKGHPYTAIIINLKINGRSVIAKFDKDSRNASSFFCPQKCPGSDSNIAGTCAQCGSAMVDRRLLVKE